LLQQSIGRCVRALLQVQVLTQVVLSEKCGLYLTYLSRIENGPANPPLNAMEVIAVGLGLTVFELFEQVCEQAQNQTT
jgi:transcriptional regulator with XRE-family HTH domain